MTTMTIVRGRVVRAKEARAAAMMTMMMTVEVNQEREGRAANVDLNGIRLNLKETRV